MCGYFANLRETAAIIDLLKQIGIALPYPVQRAYQRRVFAGLVTIQNGRAALSEALWWFALREHGDKLVPNEKYTSFNARDLRKPLWRTAARTSRGLVLATEIGEAQGKQRYLMTSSEGFALGCLYKDYALADGTRVRSFAVITRPPHHRFSRYHDKAFPLFLPMDKAAIEEWLNPEIETSPLIEEILDNPRLEADLAVTPVKTYRNAEALGATEILHRD